MVKRKSIWIGFCVLLFSLMPGCREETAAQKRLRLRAEAQRMERLRQTMVKEQLLRRDIRSARVLQAMLKVPRHLFVPPGKRRYAYEDRPLPIGHRQTISQPYIVALMAQAANIPKQGAKVLEIGTGSGYGAAVLARLAKEVYTIEIVRPLGLRAQKTLKRAGFTNVTVKVGDGYAGWPQQAPFDAIVVTAAPPYVPPALKQQLKVGGHLVIPVGGRWVQKLKVFTRTPKGLLETSLIPVRFVPMTGKVLDTKQR